jgi:hypothetical protein
MEHFARLTGTITF